MELAGVRWVGNWLNGRRHRMLIDGVVGVGDGKEWGAAGFGAGTCAVCGLY